MRELETFDDDADAAFHVETLGSVDFRATNRFGSNRDAIPAAVPARREGHWSQYSILIGQIDLSVPGALLAMAVQADSEVTSMVFAETNVIAKPVINKEVETATPATLWTDRPEVTQSWPENHQSGD